MTQHCISATFFQTFTQMIFKNYFLIVTFAGGGGLSRVNRYDAIKVSHDTLRHKLHKVEFNVHLLCQQIKHCTIATTLTKDVWRARWRNTNSKGQAWALTINTLDEFKNQNCAQLLPLASLYFYNNCYCSRSGIKLIHKLYYLPDATLHAHRLEVLNSRPFTHLIWLATPDKTEQEFKANRYKPASETQPG